MILSKSLSGLAFLAARALAFRAEFAYVGNIAQISGEYLCNLYIDFYPEMNYNIFTR